VFGSTCVVRLAKAWCRALVRLFSEFWPRRQVRLSELALAQTLDVVSSAMVTKTLGVRSAAANYNYGDNNCRRLVQLAVV
jgi:hypothetical protein